MIILIKQMQEECTGLWALVCHIHCINVCDTPVHIHCNLHVLYKRQTSSLGDRAGFHLLLLTTCKCIYGEGLAGQEWSGCREIKLNMFKEFLLNNTEGSQRVCREKGSGVSRESLITDCISEGYMWFKVVKQTAVGSG